MYWSACGIHKKRGHGTAGCASLSADDCYVVIDCHWLEPALVFQCQPVTEATSKQWNTRADMSPRQAMRTVLLLRTGFGCGNQQVTFTGTRYSNRQKGRPACWWPSHLRACTGAVKGSPGTSSFRVKSQSTTFSRPTYHTCVLPCYGTVSNMLHKMLRYLGNT